MPPTTPPSGTVTFLFTDIEGSTPLWERHPEAMRVVLPRHDALIRDAIERHGGHVFKTVGDAFYAAFAEALPAVCAALNTQRALGADRLLAVTGALFERMGAMPPFEAAAFARNVAAARAVLGEDAWASAWGEGRALSWEDAVRDALAENTDAGK